jgi:hypothetical protein
MNGIPKEIAETTRSALCHEELLEQLALVNIYSRVAHELTEIGDGPGADYALRRMGAHARAAIVARNHLAGKDDAEAA